MLHTVYGGQVFPDDIVKVLVDCAVDDKDTLRNWARVCSRTLHASRIHLFRLVLCVAHRMGDGVDPYFEHFLQHTSLRPFVKTVASVQTTKRQPKHIIVLLYDSLSSRQGGFGKQITAFPRVL